MDLSGLFYLTLNPSFSILGNTTICRMISIQRLITMTLGIYWWISMPLSRWCTPAGEVPTLDQIFWPQPNILSFIMSRVLPQSLKCIFSKYIPLFIIWWVFSKICSIVAFWGSLNFFCSHFLSLSPEETNSGLYLKWQFIWMGVAASISLQQQTRVAKCFWRQEILFLFPSNFWPCLKVLQNGPFFLSSIFKIIFPLLLKRWSNTAILSFSLVKGEKVVLVLKRIYPSV